MNDLHDYSSAQQEQDHFLELFGSHDKELKEEKKDNKKRCHYCLLPLREEKTYYRRPLKFNLTTQNVTLGDDIYGHPSCLATERVVNQSTRLNLEFHDLHTYLRIHFNYNYPIIPAPERQLLQLFCGPQGISVQTFQQILAQQRFFFRHENEAFYVPIKDLTS